MRNRDMLLEGKPDLIVAFPGGNGTKHMVTIAAKAGKDVFVAATNTLYGDYDEGRISKLSTGS